jgi:hypothetical protein
MTDPDNEDLKRMRQLYEEAWDSFTIAYVEHGPGFADDLGLAAQWQDLNRKVKKLKRAFWQGENGYLTREGEEQILRDLIGHALLAMDLLDRGFKGGTGADSSAAGRAR